MNTSQKEKRTLTDYQLRVLQIAAGVFAAAALIISLFLPQLLKLEQDNLLNYGFVVIFLAIMLGRRAVENKYRLRLSLFSLSLMLGVLAGIIIFVINMFQTDESVKLDEPVKILITAAMILALLAGIVIPAVRYFKRKEKGTLLPIRLPLPEEDEKKELAREDVSDGPLSLEQKIAAMERELENKNNDENNQRN
ncbi:MAG: sigma-E processing peptidase SpoIIGA [Christensenellales bacterium]